MRLGKYSLLVLFLCQGTAFGRNYGMAGCGLGSLIIKNDDKSQIIATTLNATGIQTSGITSGSSNCISGKRAAILQQQEHFVSINLESLRRDMIKGDGEYLQGYAELLGCKAEVYPDFAAAAKFGKSDIFRAPGAVAILEATKSMMRQDAELQNSCINLI